MNKKQCISDLTLDDLAKNDEEWASIQKFIRQFLERLKNTPEQQLYDNEYRKLLRKYNWIIPYKMEYHELHKILKQSNDENYFYQHILNYFDDNVIYELFRDIISMSKIEHREIMNQIKLSFENQSYILVNCGLLSLIDNRLSFYLKDKSIVRRQHILDKLIEQINLSKAGQYILTKYELYVMLDAIQYLFKKIDFNDITITPTKELNRHLSQHGFLFSNNRIDSLLLLNILYYLLEFERTFKDYENFIQ